MTEELLFFDPPGGGGAIGHLHLGHPGGPEADLYLGDCAEVLGLLGPVAAVITDPPYGCTDLPWDRLPTQEELERFRALAAGPVAMFGAAPPRCLKGVLALDPPPDRVYIWNNTFTLTNSDGAFWQWQPIYVWGHLRGLRRDVLSMAANSGGDEKLHPTQKPARLMAQILEAVQEEGPILDPFMGSGTTGVAAARVGRHFIGVEKDPAYFKAAAARVKAALGQPSLFYEVAP